MKTVLYVIGFILFCLGAFLLIGLINSSIEYENIVQINRPVKKSWSVFMNDELKKEWLDGYQEMELVSGEAHQPGSVYQLTVQQDGKTFLLTERVLENSAERRYSFDLENEILANKVEYLFITPEKNASTVICRNTIRANSVFMRSLFTFMKDDFQSRDAENLIRLKELVEAQP